MKAHEGWTHLKTAGSIIHLRIVDSYQEVDARGEVSFRQDRQLLRGQIDELRVRIIDRCTDDVGCLNTGYADLVSGS